MRIATAPLLAILPVLIAAPALADWSIDFETGIANNATNVFRIPGNTGTQVSLPTSFNVPAKAFTRYRLTYEPDERDTFSVLVAPLQFQGTGAVNQNVSFNGVVFPANTQLAATYRFNSYRLTYRRNFDVDGPFSWGLGFTAKIREAAIGLRGGGQATTNTNVGFVPLINFRADWELSDDFSLMLEGDALVGPVGRAEDVMVGLEYGISDSTNVRLGYRVVEGGANVAPVFNFARIDYGIIGVEHRF